MNKYKLINQECPNKSCKSDNTDIAVHDRKNNRFRCKNCGKTWVGHYKDFYYGLRTNSLKIERAILMLRAGLSIRKVAELSKVSPSTILRWKNKLHTK